MSGSSSWAFREEDARRIQNILSVFLADSSARRALRWYRIPSIHESHVKSWCRVTMPE